MDTLALDTDTLALATDTLALATDTLAHIHVTKSPGAVLTPAVLAHRDQKTIVTKLVWES